MIGAGTYVLIGVKYLKLGQRKTPLVWFSLFWLGIAVYASLDASWSLSVAFAPVGLGWGILVLQLKIVAGFVAFFGLVNYTAHVYQRGATWAPALAAFYAVAYAVVVYSYAAREPIGQELRTWGAGLTYLREGGALTDFAYVLLFAPPLIASFAYLALLPRARARVQRVRIAVTSATFILFFGGILVSWTTNAFPLWPLVEKGLALLLALAVLYLAPPLDLPRRPGRRAASGVGPPEAT